MFKFLGINLQSFTNTSEILEKGKKVPIGTITNGYKKVAEGKWLKVGKGGPNLGRTKGGNEYDEEGKPVSDKRDPKAGKKLKLETSIRDAENKARSSEKDQRLNLIEKLIKRGFSPEEAKKRVDGESKPQNASELGKTKSGKTIYEDGSELEGDDDWSAEDHKEAASSHKDSKYAEKHKEKASAKKYISKSEENTIATSNLFDSVSKDDIQKSHINRNFSRSENLPIAKKGSDIKEKLMMIKQSELIGLSAQKVKAETLKANIGTEPTECVEEYDTEGLDVQILPKLYNWSETYSENGDETCKMKAEYNSTVRKFVRCQSEIVLIDTMINNLDDSKTYNLTVQQAAILKF